MLEAKPKNWFSRELTILEDDRPVARVKFSWSSEKGELAIGETVYTIRQDPPGYCAFVLEDRDSIIARAREIRTILHHACTVEYAGRRFQLEDRSALRRNIVVREGVQFVGYIESKHLFATKVSACLPEYLPLAVKGFIIAVVMHLWRNQQSVM
jgi:hypothetical protein